MKFAELQCYVCAGFFAGFADNFSSYTPHPASQEKSIADDNVIAVDVDGGNAWGFKSDAVKNDMKIPIPSAEKSEIESPGSVFVQFVF